MFQKAYGGKHQKKQFPSLPVYMNSIQSMQTQILRILFRFEKVKVFVSGEYVCRQGIPLNNRSPHKCANPWNNHNTDQEPQTASSSPMYDTSQGRLLIVSDAFVAALLAGGSPRDDESKSQIKLYGYTYHHI